MVNEKLKGTCATCKKATAARRTKVYIAGPITGVTNYKEVFAGARAALEKLGYIVLNPAELPYGMAAGDYMRICIAMLDVADAVYMLPGWGKSLGAGIEYQLARYTGKPVVQLGEAQHDN